MITDNWLDVAAVGNSVLCQGEKPWGADASKTEMENGLGVHRGTCKEHADCLYSRQTHGMSLIVPVVYGHLSPVAFSSSVLSRTIITLGRRNLSRLFCSCLPAP